MSNDIDDRISPVRMIACLLASTLALSTLGGCQKAPKGQIVAIVNGEEISIQQLSAELQDVPVPDTVDRKLLTKLILQDVIDRELQVQQARKQGLDKTDEYRVRKQKGEEELLSSMLGHKIAQTVQFPVDREIQNYIETHPLQFAKRQRLVLDQLSFTPPKDRAKLSVLRDAHSLDAAAAALQSIGVAAERGSGAIDTGTTEPDVAAQLDKVPPGEPVLLPQGDRMIVGVITAREPIAMPSEVANVAAARAVRAATLLRESQAQIAAARDKAKITYVDPDLAPDAPPSARKR